MSKYRQPYTLFKRGKYWYYRTYDREGVRTTAHTTGQTSKALAHQYCEKLYISGTLLTSATNFREYSEHIFDDNSPYILDRDKPLAYNTINGYRMHLKYLLEYFGNMQFSDITYNVLKAYRVTLIGKFTARSINGEIFCIKNHNGKCQER